MVGAPGVMAGEIGVRPDRPRGRRFLAGSAAADKDGHAAELDKDLRSVTRNRVLGDRRAEHLNIPLGRSVGILADDMHMVEFERGIAHRLPSSFPWPDYSAMDGVID